MFTRLTLIAAYKQFLKTHHMQANMIVVGAGSACVMHGIRVQTQDIDVQGPPAFFKKMRDSGDYEVKSFANTYDVKKTDQSVEFENGISLHLGAEIADPLTTTMIDGVCCYSLDHLLEQKMALNRPKDQDDIKALLKLKKRKPAAANWK